MNTILSGDGRGRFASFVPWLILAILVLTLGMFFIRTGNAAAPTPSLYQAVFLTNNQVYFGKLTVTPGHYVLRDVYYLQTGRVPEAKKEGAPATETKLIKLGDELHSPEDAMYIERSSTLYWEDLKGNSKITEAIKKHKQQAAQSDA